VPLLKEDSAAVARHAGGEANRAHRIGLVHQKEPSDDGVDGRFEHQPFERFGSKGDSIETFVQRAPPCLGNDSRVVVRGDDRAAAPDPLGDEERRLGKSAAEDEDPHPRRDSRAGEQFFS
jgi:hypothetical protein